MKDNLKYKVYDLPEELDFYIGTRTDYFSLKKRNFNKILICDLWRRYLNRNPAKSGDHAALYCNSYIVPVFQGNYDSTKKIVKILYATL